ncbi:MAG TPA: hypothetical protein VIE65_08585 [Methylobacter sp.]|jgi:hypothetical protein
MPIGPFTTYAPPGVYTRTITEPVVSQLLGGLRVPVLIGVGQETLSQTDFEMVRGSSSSADTPIFGEDPTARWVIGGTPQHPVLGDQDGTRTQFKVRNFPIVDGEGAGRTTFEVTRVSVFVDGEQTVVSSVDGTNGLITILVPPDPTSVVTANYYFHRKDTRAADDVSDQVTEGSAILIAPKAELYTITLGTSDTLEVFVNDATASVGIKLTPGTRSSTDVANDINVAAIPGLLASVHIDNQGLQHVQLVAQGNVRIGSGNANAVFGYNPGDYTNRTKAFRVFNGPIVDGSDGGITTTDTSKVVVLVNGIQIIPASVDGANSLVTLQSAPADGSIVTIQYWFNTFQDTFDYLPNSNIVTVGNVGISPGRRDFINGQDFVIINDGDQSKIVWGTAFQVVAGTTTGSMEFDSTQVSGTLVDDRVFGAPCTRYTDPVTNSVSTTVFILPLKPTTGNGRDTPLGSSLFNSIANGRIDLPTNRPDLITVYVGKTFRDAFSRPPVVITQVDSSTNKITLRDPVEAENQVFATFWFNRIADDTYTLKVVTPGPSSIGKFTVTSQLQDNINLYQTKFGSKTALAQTVQWPSGVETSPDSLHFGGTPVAETVTVTFDTSLLPATHASFSAPGNEPYDLYTYTRIFGGVVVDGNPSVSVDLSLGFVAELVSQPISNPASLSFLSSARLVVQVDGINIAPIDVSAATTIAAVVTAINSAIDADAQVHADGSGTFASTSPNNLASSVSYGAQALLKIKGRNTPTQTNGLLSNVKVLVPTAVGQTDAAPSLQFSPNQESSGSWDALNQPARIVPTKIGPYSVTAAVNDSFLFNVDGSDYNATLPSGTAVPVSDIVNYINAAYAAFGPAADQATALAAAISLANQIRTEYSNHIANSPGAYHTLADAVNTITAAAATDLPSLITLVNDEKVKFNAHISNTGGVFHTIADSVNTVTTPNATDLQSAIKLAYEIKQSFNAHRTQAGVHSSNDTNNIVTLSNTELVAVTGQGINAGKFYLESRTNTVSSIITISQLGTANTVLGFVPGATATRIQPTAAALAAALNSNSSFNALAVAYRMAVQGLGGFLRIDSLSAGTGSTLSFISVSNTAFIPDTGIGIIPGTSGDVGEAAAAGYRVTSSNPAGSSGTGTPGQTYTDAKTGLRFTVLPASSGDYANGGSFTLIVSSTWTADASIPSKGIPGLELFVFNTIGMAVDTTALLTTYSRTGNEPAIGDTYFVSYQYAKTDLTTALFRDLRQIQQNFGPPTPDFPLSMAARLALLNGAVLVGLKQVLKAANSSQAPISSYVDAINEQRRPIEGSVKPDVIIPLGTDPQIFAALNAHCVFMSSPRMEGERIGVVGVAAGTQPTGVRAIAQGLVSELMVVTYPDIYVVTITDDNGNQTDQLVDGTFMAAALAATSCNPSIDVATPWTRRSVIGFKRLGRVLDPTEANQVAVGGVSIIEQVDAGMRVRHGLTTNLASVITRTPSVTLTIQFVQQSIRRVLDPYIGQKFTGSLLKGAENSMTGLFSTLIDQQIVTKIAGISAEVDVDDPTIMRTNAIYVPVFPLEYVVSTLQVRIRI